MEPLADHRQVRDGILTAAYRANVPIFCPAIADSSISPNSVCHTIGNVGRMNPCLAQGCDGFTFESPLGHTHKPPEGSDGHIDRPLAVIVDHLQTQVVVDLAHSVRVRPRQRVADVAERHEVRATTEARLLRQLLSRIEDEKTGRILLEGLHAQVPDERLEQARRAAEVLDTAIYDKFPLVPGLRPMADELAELVLNRTWRPALSVTGVGGIPSLDSAGNVLRPHTAGVYSSLLGGVPRVGAPTQTFETLFRPWNIDGLSVRPFHRMVAHTGFLTTARLVSS